MKGFNVVTKEPQSAEPHETKSSLRKDDDRELIRMCLEGARKLNPEEVLAPIWNARSFPFRDGHKSITIATDCSGIEVPIQALTKIGVPHIHESASEKNHKLRWLIKSVFDPGTVYSDLRQRRDSKQTNVDIYVVGFPCCLLYTSPSPRDLSTSRMPSSA